MIVKNLSPGSMQKSFYGKAKVIDTQDGWKYLKSYNTLIAGIRFTNNGYYLKRLSSAKSATTSRHIDVFLEAYVDGAMDHREFYTIDLEPNYEHPEIDEEQ